jgi:hypothetical protein
MRSAPPRTQGAALAAALVVLAAGCGKSGARSTSTSATPAPVARQGAVSLTTRNTTRLGGADPASDAAAVARLVYPGLTPRSRPGAVVVVDEHDWPGTLAAAALASAPLHAPLLYGEGSSLPSISSAALAAMQPSGAQALAGVQLISIGAGRVRSGYVERTLRSGSPAGEAAEIEALLAEADGGHPPRQVIVLAAEAPPALAMPAAGLAAESGTPILYVSSAGVPAATARVLATLRRPAIYVVAPGAVGARTLHALARFGAVTSITPGAGEGRGAVAGAIAVARFGDASFGWGVREPGHGLAFANATRPLDAPASALLSSTGDYAPLLLLEGAAPVPAPLASYLSDIQPAYTSAPQFRPVRGVYNHGWLIGDERAISAVTQAELDSMLEIAPRKSSPEEASANAGE